MKFDVYFLIFYTVLYKLNYIFKWSSLSCKHIVACPIAHRGLAVWRTFINEVTVIMGRGVSPFVIRLRA